ncbi:MAG: HAMP domain-containing histidine kinase [Bacteroidales bacterium]|nr:HAMP domain-containing histidine kinase [Bacteroidales bacterium]
MKRRFISKLPLLLLSALLVIALGTRCSDNTDSGNDMIDGLMNGPHDARLSDRILVMVDSLQPLGELSPIKAAYLRGYAYSKQNDRRKAEILWTEAVTPEPLNEEDIKYHAMAANRLSNLDLLKGEYESALRVAVSALDKLRAAGMDSGIDYAHLLIAVGCCDLHFYNFADARENFEGAYSEFLKKPGQYNSTMAALITITDQCLAHKRYSDAQMWAGRLQEVLDEYKKTERAKAVTVDKQQARVCLYKASALEGLGYHAEAADYYDDAMESAYTGTPDGRIEAVNYLMLAQRWEEAADNLQLLDSQLSGFGAVWSMDNITRYLLPKFEANYRSRRSAAALETGMQICNSIDSALLWMREDKAAELAAVYHNQEIKQDLVKQDARIQRDRFIATIIGMMLLILGLILFLTFRRRSAQRLKEAYVRLEEANDRAQEASRVKTAFLQQISHEIGTPLNMISGFAQVLTTPGIELDEESRAQINTGVIDNTKRITGLIGKILELSNLVSSSEIEKTDRVRASDIAADAAAACGIVQNAEIDYSLILEGEDPEMITNRTAAGHILTLLLENAVKYTGKGAVRLGILASPDEVSFVVEDTGIGIPPEDAERVFGQFVQLDDYQEGTGIGLSLARSLSRRLGGDVVLDTSYSSGARFVLTLPRKTT